MLCILGLVHLFIAKISIKRRERQGKHLNCLEVFHDDGSADQYVVNEVNIGNVKKAVTILLPKKELMAAKTLFS